MKHAYFLRLENPCSEEWDSMQDSENGKYCSSCRKNIIDFTNLSNNEIIKVLENSHSDLCGRVRADQLNTRLSVIENQSWFSGAYKFVTGLLLLVTAIKVNAQEAYKKNKITVSPLKTNKVSIKHQDTVTYIKGKVINNETSSAISGVSLKITGTSISAITDSLGKFQIDIPDSLTGKNISLEAYKEDYSHNQIIVKASAINQPQVIGLYESQKVTVSSGGLVFGVYPKKKKWWRRLF